MDKAKSTVDRFTPPVQGCQFCDHPPGLAVLPVRYAVVGPECKRGAPPLAGNFKIENAPEQLGGGAQYTLRTMRPGFLYVFHEAMQLWDCYLVINGGHLWKIIPERPAPQRVSNEFSCSMGIGHGYTSMYFTIPDPKNATTVWYAYSHIAWTPAQLDENKYKRDVRSKHMQPFNVRAWMDSPNQPHAARTIELGQHVASFAMSLKDQDEAFRYLSAPPRVKAGGRLDLIGDKAGAILSEAMERTSPGHAVMLAFNDPLGVTEDLALLTYPQMNPTANNGIIWDETTDFLLDRLESNIRENVLRKMTKEEEDARAEAARMGVNEGGISGFELIEAILAPDKMGERWKREAAERDATRKARQQAAADAAWAPYAAVLDNSKRHQDLAQRLKDFNEKVLAPIALSHSQWLQSAQLRDYMTYRHDNRDLAHGYRYNEVVTRCLEHGLQNVECRKVIRHWYEEANPEKDSNLLARALYLNCEPIIKAAVGPTDQAYGAMLEVFKSGMNSIDASAKDLSLPDAVAKLGLVPRLAWVLSDEIIPALANKLGSKTAAMFLDGLSLFGGVHLIGMSRSIMQIRHDVLRDLESINPDLYKQLGRSKRREEAVVMARQAKRLAAKGRLIWYSTSDLISSKGLGALQLRTEYEIPGVRQVRAVLGSSYVNIGALTAILQGLAVYHATQSFRAAGEFDEAETGTKLVGGLLALTGAFAEQAGIALEKAPTHPFVARVMRTTPQAEWVAKGKTLAGKGRWIGLAGATVGIFLGWVSHCR